MCPACMTSAVLIVAGTAGATSAGWLIPLAIRKHRKKRSRATQPHEKNHGRK